MTMRPRVSRAVAVASSSRSRARALVALGAVVGLVASTGCALLTKAEPLEPRFFTPESTAKPGGGASASAASGLELRLARVNAGSSIRDRLVYRDAGHEVGYYEERRWTEKPEAYVRRALSRALFERRGVAQVIAGAAPTLDVDVIAFEEVRAPSHLARVELAFTLHDERAVRLADSVVIEKAVAVTKDEASAEAVVQGLGDAMEAAVESVAARVTERLVADRAAPPAHAAGAQ
jgi:cholesterol transport system auxiliary component